MTAARRERPRPRLPAGVRDAVLLSAGHTGAVYRGTLHDGRPVKVRPFTNGARADRVWRLLVASHGVLARPIARRGRTLAIEFIEGTPLILHSLASDDRTARALGRLLAELHRVRPPRLRAPALTTTRWLLTRTTRRLVRAGLLTRRTADALLSIAAPTAPDPFVITLGDGSPSNFITTARGRLRAIDEDRVDLRPSAFDLARVITQWPMTAKQERAMLTAYRAAGGDLSGFQRDRRFWLATALSTSAAYRLTRDPAGVGAIARRLTALAHHRS